MSLTLFTIDELENLPDPEWLVEGLVGQNALVELFGKPGVGKSFLALDLAMSVAAGVPWLGQTTKQGDVVYIYGEGTTRLKWRVSAWRNQRATNPGNIAFLPQPLDIVAKGDDLVKAIGRKRLTPVLIVIDTLARCFGGGDENATKDMNAFVASLDALRETYSGATILVVHHTGKNAGKGERGSTVLRGAVDTVMCLEGKTMSLKLTCEKQKDGDDFLDIPLQLTPVDLSGGKGSCVVQGRSEMSAARSVRASKLPMADKIALEALRNFSPEGASFTDWYKQTGLRKSTFMDARRRLLESRHVMEEGGRYRTAEPRTKAETGTDQPSSFSA